MRTRVFLEHNYLSVYDGRVSSRFQIEDDLPITELKFPEFYDVKITNKCSGKCPWCYMDSQEEGEHFENILDKAAGFFGIMDENQKPFQVAIGGGNPNEHPDFPEFVRYLASIGITPNYTTNGMGLTEEVLAATRKHCGGVAVSAHPHLEQHWTSAVLELTETDDLVVNLHLIISDWDSVDEFASIFWSWRDVIDYFVLLPYEAVGRAEPKEIHYNHLGKTLERMEPHEIGQIAFGAGFYPWLLTQNFPVSLYEPELMSKFLDMSDMKLYKSSFDLTEVEMPL